MIILEITSKHCHNIKDRLRQVLAVSVFWAHIWDSGLPNGWLNLVSYQQSLCNKIIRWPDISFLSLIRVSSAVNCQSTTRVLLFRAFSHAVTSLRTISREGILRFKHCPNRTFSSISAIFSREPCSGVYTNSTRSIRRFAFSGGNAVYHDAALCVLRLSSTRIIYAVCKFYW